MSLVASENAALDNRRSLRWATRAIAMAKDVGIHAFDEQKAFSVGWARSSANGFLGGVFCFFPGDALIAWGWFFFLLQEVEVSPGEALVLFEVVASGAAGGGQDEIVAWAECPLFAVAAATPEALNLVRICVLRIHPGVCALSL